MLLKGKSAVIYGAGGAVGSATARAFAREGARLFLAGRGKERLDELAGELRETGVKVHTASVDALDREAVQDHLDEVMSAARRLDISFNLMAMNDVQGKALIDMDGEDFLEPVTRVMRGHFNTAGAAGRRMSEAGTGVILMLTASPGRVGAANVGGFGPACGALESLARQLGVELGADGVRVVCLRSAGSPDTPGVKEVFEIHAKAKGMTPRAFAKMQTESTALHRLPLLDEVANAAAMIASDYAAPMTSTVANLTCGGSAD